jgi:hypothetical protein
MSGFVKAAAIVMFGGAIVGAGILAMLPEENSAPLSATVPTKVEFPEISPAPCRRPLWPNAEGACQAWVLPHRELEGLLASEPTRAGAAHDSTLASGTVRGRTARAENNKGRRVQANNASRRIPVAPRMASVTQRGTTIAPTWRQDAFHPGFPERRNDMTRMFAFFGAPAR